MDYEFTESALLKQLVKDIEYLNFDYLKNGDQGFMGVVKDEQTTPKDTGYTESMNNIRRNGEEVIFENNNTEYGQDLYNSGRSFKQIKNANANDRWFDLGLDNYMTTRDLIAEEIEAEIAERLR